jgi:Putative beta-barrel porin 2
MKMPRQFRVPRSFVGLPPVFMVLCSPVSAQEAAAPEQKTVLTFAVGGVSSDNIQRLSVDEEAGTIGTAGIRFAYGQQTRRIDTDIDLNAAYQHYFDDEYDDDVIGGVNATLDVGLVPDRLLWTFRENFGQISFNPLEASTPDNRENLNLFTTGPSLILNFGDATELKISALHSSIDYEDRNLDGTQDQGELTLSRQLSGKSTLSAILNAGRYQFDDEIANPDYDKREALARYEIRGSRTTLTADLGYTEIEIDDKSDGMLARLSVSRQVSEGGRLAIGAGTEFSSAGDIFRLDQGVGGVQLDDENVIGTSDPFERNYANIGYDFDRHRTTLGVSANYSSEQYETSSALDRKVMTYSAYFTRRLSAVLSARLFASLDQDRYDELDVDIDETTAGVSADWVLGRRLTLRFQYEHTDRESSNDVSEYTENQFSLFMLWSPVQR